MRNPIPAMRLNLLTAISLFTILLLAAPVLHAQEAPGEDVPGMRTTREGEEATPAPPPSAKSKELSPKERQGLNNMFQGKLDGEKASQPSTSVIINPTPAAPQPPVAAPAPAPAESSSSSSSSGGTEAQHPLQPLVGTVPLEPAITPLKSPALYMNTARLLKFTILNKQTTRMYNQELADGTSVTYGPLTIKLLECYHSSPDATPDSAALLQVTETREDGRPKQIFLGWMFASAPSLNPLEHPVYDITVKECK